MKYSDQLVTWLSELGYTHCFFLGGGNIMHLVESCSRKLACVPVVHEVAAGIAAEYFNEVSESGRAFALVTAGPGITNVVTAMAGAYLDSHELLVIGGQVKVADLAQGEVRQRGIQEIDGVGIARPVAVKSALMDCIWDRATFADFVEAGSFGRKGPVFLEIPLDLQGASVNSEALSGEAPTKAKRVFDEIPREKLMEVISLLRRAQRPVLLLGGGISRATAACVLDKLEALCIPVMVTWNGLDRVPDNHPMFFGRPNTWGQRSANILMQQADLLVALGTRLGLQQTGFNWREFLPLGKVVQVDCDQRELKKGHPRVDLPICGDANFLLKFITEQTGYGDYSEWLGFCREVKELIPLDDPRNSCAAGFISPYQFCLRLSELSTEHDVVVPCSSGGANTVMQQTFQVKRGQKAFNNGGLAAMGYGLCGAIGAAIAADGRRTILVDGDGGFIQNIQELGTVSANRLNLKIFIFDNNGYASIRTTQRNYFAGHYVGCDPETGLGLPNWDALFAAYGIPLMPISAGYQENDDFLSLFDSKSPAAFLVRIDPNQTYFPKINSRVRSDGTMESNPLHLMSPDLPPDLAAKVLRYLYPSPP
jgi:acetolactate synthase I/II/III large subunit